MLGKSLTNRRGSARSELIGAIFVLLVVVIIAIIIYGVSRETGRAWWSLLIGLLSICIFLVIFPPICDLRREKKKCNECNEANKRLLEEAAYRAIKILGKPAKDIEWVGNSNGGAITKAPSKTLYEKYKWEEWLRDSFPEVPDADSKKKEVYKVSIKKNGEIEVEKILYSEQ